MSKKEFEEEQWDPRNWIHSRLFALATPKLAWWVNGSHDPLRNYGGTYL